MKNFKRFEQGFVDFLNTLGLWPAELLSRSNNGRPVMDASWGPFSIEMKTEKHRAKKLSDWVTQSIRNRDGLLPIVVHHQDYECIGDELVFMKWEYFMELVKKAYGKE